MAFAMEIGKDNITMVLGDLKRVLPVREVKPGVRVALFNPLGDHELNEALGAALSSKIPEGTQVLLMPDGKAQALLHVLGRNSKLLTMVAKKEVKSYMKQPVVKGARDECMTSAGGEAFYLGADQVEELKGKKVLIVDDVVSTGGSVKAMRQILKATDAQEAGVLCVFTEGGERADVIALGNLPVNDPAWS